MEAPGGWSALFGTWVGDICTVFIGNEIGYGRITIAAFAVLILAGIDFFIIYHYIC